MKTDKILHLVQQKKAMRSGGALPLPKAQTGMPVTTADSLRVFNAQMALNKFYADEARKGRLKLDSSISLSDGVWDLQRRTANELKNKNLDFYRGEISSRQNRRGHGPWDDLYEKYFNLTPQQLKRLEYQGIARTNSGTDNVFYYRDLITPLQNLASPFAVLDTRIKPQRIISYTPINDKDDQYPGGNVDVYDYDPLAVKPFYLRTPQEQKQWEEKYGKTKVTSASSPRLTAARKPETMQLMKSIPSRFESSDIDMQPVGRPVPPIPTRPEMYMDMRGEWMMKPAISDSVLMNDPRFIQKSGYRKSEKKSGGLAKAQKGIVNQNAYDLWYKYNTPEGRAGIPDLYSDYDYRKYFEDAVTGVNPMGFDEESMHFPDTYKYPWHPSFSDESVYYVNQKETPGLSYQTKQKGGLTKHQSRGQVAPFITSDPVEYQRRQQAYTDSLNIYNKYIQFKNRVANTPINTIEEWIEVQNNRPYPINLPNNLGIAWDFQRGSGSFDEPIMMSAYKKPVQKVIFNPEITKMPLRNIPLVDVNVEAEVKGVPTYRNWNTGEIMYNIPEHLKAGSNWRTYQKGGLTKAQNGLPVNNPHLPNTPLATGAATPTMSPIDVAIAAMTGAGLVPSAVKLSKSILNAQPEDRRWMNSMIPFWEAHIANNTRETYEKARDMYKNADKKQTGGEESGLQYVPSGDYGRYYDPETKEYVPQVYLPDVEISASKDLPFQNNKFAPFLAARGMAKYVPLETIFLPGTPVVKGLGKVGNVLLDAVNPLAGMRNLKSSIPDYTPSPAYVEALERLNQTRAKYLDELNKLQESPQVGKSLGDITADIDALNASIKPKSEATTGDLQNMLDQLRSINANLEQHVPLHRRAFTSSDISEQLARQAQDPGDMPGTGVSDVGEAISMQDRIKNFEDIQRQEGIGLSAKYLGRTPQGARFEFVPEKYMIDARGLTAKEPIIGSRDFYTPDEITANTNQWKEYWEARDKFDELSPEDPGSMIMSAFTGDKSRMNSFENLFPNAKLPNWREKFYHPEQIKELRELLPYEDQFKWNDPLAPKGGLKFFQQRISSSKEVPSTVNDYLSRLNDTWHLNDPRGYVSEMRGSAGLSLDDIKNLSDDEVKNVANTIHSKILKQNEDRVMDDIFRTPSATPSLRGFTVGQMNKLGGLTSSKAKEILHDESVHGHPLTDKQRKFFGAIASGKSYKVRVKKNKQ